MQCSLTASGLSVGHLAVVVSSCGPSALDCGNDTALALVGGGRGTAGNPVYTGAVRASACRVHGTSIDHVTVDSS
jgi:hypothetical protein